MVVPGPSGFEPSSIDPLVWWIQRFDVADVANHAGAVTETSPTVNPSQNVNPSKTETSERPPLRDECRNLLDKLVEMKLPDFGEMSAERAREIFIFLRVEPEDLPEVGSITEQAVPGPAGDIPVRIYRPESTPEGPPPVMVWFHGGGWVLGNLETSDLPCRAMTSGSGCVIVSVDYRLAPENPFPAAFEDCMAVTEWVIANADELDVDSSRIAVGGDSAGGNLAACVAVEAVRQDLSLVHQHLVYPVIAPDYSTDSYRENASGYFLTRNGMEWFWDQYTDADDHGDPRVVPVAAEPELLTRAAPAYVFTAGYDPLRDEGRDYAELLTKAGVPVEQAGLDDVIHGVFGMTLTCGDEARAASIEALRRAFAS